MTEDDLLPGIRLCGFVNGDAVRFLAVDVTPLVPAMRAAHHLGLEAACLAAEGLVATALLGGQIKGDERLTLQLQGESPQCAFVGEVDATGAVRACVRVLDAIEARRRSVLRRR